MKKSKLLLFLVMVLSIVMINSKVFAETITWLSVTFENHSVGDNATFQTGADLAGGETLQLYAVIGASNSCGNPAECGWHVQEANLRGINWKSDDPYIATVDSNGKITGISKGKTKITASNDEYVAVFEVNVTSGERPAKMPDEVVTNDPEDITPSEPDEIVTNEPEDITTTNPGEVTNEPEDVTTNEPEDVTTNEPENINPTEQDGNNTDVQKDIAPVDENKPTSQSNNNTVMIVAIAAGVLVVGLGIWLLAKNKKNN